MENYSISIRTHAKQLNHLAWGAKKRHGMTWKAAMQFAFDALRIKQRMATSVISFAYIKLSTGEVRNAKGTRDLAVIPTDKHPKGTSTKPETTNTVSYFDLDVQGWRSFDVTNLTPAI